MTLPISLHDAQMQIVALRNERDALLALAIGLDAFIDRHAGAIQRDQSDTDTLAAAEEFRSDWFGGGWGVSTRDQLKPYRATGPDDLHAEGDTP